MINILPKSNNAVARYMAFHGTMIELTFSHLVRNGVIRSEMKLTWSLWSFKLVVSEAGIIVQLNDLTLFPQWIC